MQLLRALSVPEFRGREEMRDLRMSLHEDGMMTGSECGQGRRKVRIQYARLCDQKLPCPPVSIRNQPGSSSIG